MKQGNYLFCTERLGFRWWETNDFELAQSLWGDHEVTKLFMREPLTSEAVMERLEAEFANREALSIQYWPIFELSSGEFVGCCGLKPSPRAASMFELGYHLRPAFWGKGYATEAARGAIKYAIERTTVPSLFAGRHPDNELSGKVLLKVGFTELEPMYYEPTGFMHPTYHLDLKR